MKKKVVKLEKLTDHITYRILNNTIYLLLESDNILEDEFEIAFKKVSLLIEDNNISYINISGKKIEDRSEFYKKLGFNLSYYDVNKLNILYSGYKDKKLYKCYGIMTKSDFFNVMKEINRVEEKKQNINVINSNSGFVSDVLLLLLGISLLCFFNSQAIIYFFR